MLTPAVLALALCSAASLDGDASFDAGKKLYDELEYEQAVFRFQEVALRTTLTKEDKATALVWLGLSYAGVGDLDGAKRTLTDAVRANRATELPIEVSPRIVELFAEVKATVAAEPPPVDTDTSTSTTSAKAAPAEEEGLPIAAVVGTAAGGLLLVAGVGLAALGALSYGAATDRNATQLGAKAALETANIELLSAGVLVPVGAAVGGLSTYFLVAD